MDDYRDAIASCCRQLRLSANLADHAFAIQGETHQEYLYNLLSEEIKCRKAARIVNITVRRSRQSGVARATCPD